MIAKLKHEPERLPPGDVVVKTIDESNTILEARVLTVGHALELAEQLPRDFPYYIYDKKGNLLVANQEPRIKRENLRKETA